MSLIATPQPVELTGEITATFANLSPAPSRFAVIILLGAAEIEGSHDLDWAYLNGLSTPPPAPVLSGSVKFSLAGNHPMRINGTWGVVIVTFADGPFQGASAELARTNFTVGPIPEPEPEPEPELTLEQRIAALEAGLAAGVVVDQDLTARVAEAETIAGATRDLALANAEHIAALEAKMARVRGALDDPA